VDRQAWIGAAVIVLLQCAAALVQSSGEYVSALIAGVTGGLTAAAVLWWLIRYDVRMIPAYVATGSILTALVRTIQVGTTDAWIGFALNAAATAGVAWLVTRYIAQPLPAPAADALPVTAASPTSG
jgi:hypothetical protein